MLEQISQWLDSHLAIFGLPAWVSLLVITVFMAVVSVLVTIAALIRIPAAYFLDSYVPAERYRHPVLRWAWRIIRNLLGWFLVVLGILLLPPGVPGQGLLTILLGLMLVEFPGKRRLEQRFVRWQRVRNAVNALRTKFGRAPLLLDNDDIKSPADCGVDSDSKKT